MIAGGEGGVYAHPSQEIGPGMCGHPDCDQPAVYGVQFSGWSAEKQTGACAEHVRVARSLANVERVWSLAGVR